MNVQPNHVHAGTGGIVVSLLSWVFGALVKAAPLLQASSFLFSITVSIVTLAWYVHLWRAKKK